MTELQAIVLGVIQGISEFLPISSSGHLILLPKLFGWEEQSIGFDIAVHFGTLLAICFVMRSELVEILVRMRYNLDFALKVVLATIPAVLFGLLVGDKLLAFLRSPAVVAVNLAVFGALLFVADHYRNRVYRKPGVLPLVTWINAFLIGLAQMIAIIPGVSRSGITMTAGLFLRMDRNSTARFSFLLAIPVIFGAGIMTLLDFQGTESASIVAIGIVSAAISGWLSASLLLRLISHISLGWFALYRILLAVVIFLFFV